MAKDRGYVAGIAIHYETVWETLGIWLTSFADFSPTIR